MSETSSGDLELKESTAIRAPDGVGDGDGEGEGRADDKSMSGGSKRRRSSKLAKRKEVSEWERRW